MDLVFLAIFIIILALIGSSMPAQRIPECTEGHSWYWNEEGNLVCKQCKKRPEQL